MTGIFITFEGIDGAGKSTHIERLAEQFLADGREVVVTREPGGTPLGEKLRTLLINDAMDELTESLLVFAARREHVKKVILPALASGKVVLCDRFSDSTFAYQGVGKNVNWSGLQYLEQWILSLNGGGACLSPNLTLWFDLLPITAAKRLNQARVADRFECLPVEYFAKVREGYKKRQQEHPERFALIDADQAVEKVWLDIKHIVEKRWCKR